MDITKFEAHGTADRTRRRGFRLQRTFGYLRLGLTYTGLGFWSCHPYSSTAPAAEDRDLWEGEPAGRWMWE